MGITSQKYAAALFPDTYRVRGVRMQDYTLGHALLLERLGNPFVVGGKQPGCGDVAQFIAICRRTYPEALRMVSNERRSAWAVWRSRPAPVYRLVAVQEILRYMSAASTMPARWENEEGSPLGTPFLQQVKLTLMMALGKSELQALCTPFALALWDACGCWEIEGRIRLADEDTLADVKRVIEQSMREAGKKPKE